MLNKKRKSNSIFPSNLLRIFLLVFLFFMQVSCSDDSEYNEEKIRKAHLEQIDFAKQKECNDQQKFYDNLEQEGTCSQVYALSEWQCNFENLKTNVEEIDKDFFISSLANLREYTENGFIIHQCGQGDLGLRVILIKQDSNSNRASTEIRRFDFPYFRPRESSKAP